MRWIKFIVYLILTTIFVVFLSRPSGKIPFALGSFLSPFHGFWKNAVPEIDAQTESLEFSGLKAPVKVVTDARRVPHIFAENQDDLAFTQGFVTARDRLWQMEFQIYAASGRLSEVLGAGPENAILNYDREMRRKGLGWAAERACEVVESNPEYSRWISSYANGVNAYIETLSPSDYPIEYKLLHYKPEKWSTLKTTYLFKFMANTLSGRAMDRQYTRALQLWGPEMMDLLYPERPRNQDPIIPVNHPWFFAPKPTPNIPAGYRPDSLPNLLTPAPAVSHIEHSQENPWQINPEDQLTEDQILGSNNWAVHGPKNKIRKNPTGE